MLGRPRGTLLLAAATLGVIAQLGLAPEEAPQAKSSKKPCDHVLKRGGDLQRFVNGLRKGQTGCLSAGVHAGGVTISKPRVTVRSRPGRKATIQGGQVRVSASARGARLTHLKLTTNQFSPVIYASKAVVAHNSITNDHTDICVVVDRFPGAPVPKGVRIEGNRIHDCGQLPAANFAHGIYVTQARGTLIRRNLIHDNADRGIQLYPNANRTRIVDNVIDSNGEGVLFGGTSHDNTVVHNIISNSTIRHNVESVGSGAHHNMVRENCLWTKQTGYYSGKPRRSGIMQEPRRFTVHQNLVRNPDYRNGYRSNRC
jgi:parallel beta-helix repeat protein